MIDDIVKNTVDRINENKRKNQELSEEVIEKYKLALNSVASTENGQYFLRCLANMIGAYMFNEHESAQDRIISSYRRDVYFCFIRKYLDKDVRKQLED